MKRLHNKVAVITGACSGIGLATTELFLAEGAQVVAADVQDEVGQQLQKQYADQLFFAHCDVTRLDELRSAIDSAAAHFGGLDILFSNAGRIGTMAGVQGFHAQAWDDTQNLLLRSLFRSPRATPRLCRLRRARARISCPGLLLCWM